MGERRELFSRGERDGTAPQDYATHTKQRLTTSMLLPVLFLLLSVAREVPACVYLREARTVRCHNASLPDVGDALRVLTQLAPNRPATLELEGCRPGDAHARLPPLFSGGTAAEGVRQLRVRRCGLRGVDGSALTPLRRGLRHLDLSHNLLRVVPDALRGLQALERLELQHNRIVFVRPGGALNTLPALRALDLAHNRIGLEEEEEDNGTNGYRLKGSLPMSDFSVVPGLQALSLRGNRLAAVPEQVSAGGLPELLSLDLSENVVANVDTLDLPKLQDLDLHANRIQGVPVLPQALARLDLTDNPLHCDCDVVWLAEWAESSDNSSLRLPPCQSPDKFKGRELGEVPWHDECPDEKPAFRYMTHGSGDYDVVEVTSNSTSITLAWRVRGSPHEQKAWTVVYRRATDSPSHMTLVPAPAPGPDRIVRLSIGRLRPVTDYVLCVALARDGKYAVEPRKCVRSATAAAPVRTHLRGVAAGKESVTLSWRLEAPALPDGEGGVDGAAYRHEWTIRVRRTGSDNYTDIPVYDITTAEETDGQSYEYGVSDLAPRTHYDVCLVDVEHAPMREGAPPPPRTQANATCATVQTLGRDSLQGGEIVAVVFACALCVAVCVLTAVLWYRRSRLPPTPSERFMAAATPPLPPPLPRAQLAPPPEKRKPVPGAWNTMRLPYTDFSTRPEFRSFRTAAGGGYRDALTSVTIYGSGYSEC